MQQRRWHSGQNVSQGETHFNIIKNGQSQGSLHVWFISGFRVTYLPHRSHLVNHQFTGFQRTQTHTQTEKKRNPTQNDSHCDALQESTFILSLHFESPRGNFLCMKAICLVHCMDFFEANFCLPQSLRGFQAPQVQKVIVINKQHTNRLDHIKTWYKCDSRFLIVNNSNENIYIFFLMLNCYRLSLFYFMIRCDLIFCCLRNSEFNMP